MPILLMISTIILGMGLPSAVCYLLMATLVIFRCSASLAWSFGGAFVHFLFWDDVRPRLWRCRYTAAAIARSGIMATGLAAFSLFFGGICATVCFVFRPELR
ncbi:MAG: hypothetical protein R3C26_04915 [Calditrichia bacterium]